LFYLEEKTKIKRRRGKGPVVDGGPESRESQVEGASRLVLGTKEKNSQCLFVDDDVWRWR
jgi:hypothetical protein